MKLDNKNECLSSDVNDQDYRCHNVQMGWDGNLYMFRVSVFDYGYVTNINDSDIMLIKAYRADIGSDEWIRISKAKLGKAASDKKLVSSIVSKVNALESSRIADDLELMDSVDTSLEE